MSEGTILKEAFNACKTGNHDWIANLSNCLKANGLTYIYTNLSYFSVDFIGNLLKSKIEEQYIKNWDNKSRISSKLNFLHVKKKTNYNKSMYLR